MRIALYHGYELSGSGSNEYNRYLASALSHLGHEVHLLCREPTPQRLALGAELHVWDERGEEVRRKRIGPASTSAGRCILHLLPHAPVRPVFLADKQREGRVKTFPELSAEELAVYHRLNVRVLSAVLRAHPVDILHANHMVYQPVVAAEVCVELGIPFVIYPHGSAIEYTLQRDARYADLAGRAIERCAGLIIGSDEVRQRLLGLYPELAARIRARSRIVGVGVDTALFAPIQRAHRRAAIEELIERWPGGGKSEYLSAELRRRLDAGDLEAVRAYRHAYRHDAPDAAQRLGELPAGARIILYVGALTAGKGVHHAIVALPAVLEQVPDAHLLIVGSGSYREVLEALAHALDRGDADLLGRLVACGYDLEEGRLEGPWSDIAIHLRDARRRTLALSAAGRLRSHLHFLGRLDHDLLRFLLPCADMALFPSLIPEAYPLVLMESLAAGILPLASDFSGFAEGFDNLVPLLGEDLVEKLRLPCAEGRRVEGIVESLLVLLRDATAAPSAERLRHIAVEHYDWGRRARQMVRAYAELGF